MRLIISILIALLIVSCGPVAPARSQEGPYGGRQSSLNITAGTVVKAAPGKLWTFTVTTAGAAGAVYDTTTTGSVAASNLIAVIPATVGVYQIAFPVLRGIVVVPGAAQVVSVSYQ